MTLSAHTRLVPLVIALCLAASAPSQLGAAEKTVEIRTVGGSPGLTASVEERPGPGASRYLEVTITNTADADLLLDSISLTLPWVAKPADRGLVVMGPAAMFSHPTTIVDPSAAVAESAAFLMRQDPDGRGHAFAGLLSWRRMRTKLRFEESGLVIHGDGEKRRLAPGDSFRLDRLWCSENPGWQELLFAYAREIARENGISLRRRADWVGWSNWDYYGGRFTSGQILRNLQALVAMNVGANLVQVDGGWWRACGDYETANDRIEGGVEALAQAIRAHGMTAGIHIDGARADMNSKVVRDHPEFFLHTSTGELIVGERTRPSGGRAFYDFSHPGAREHLRDSLRSLRARGFDYMKVDFLRFIVPEYLLKAANLNPAEVEIRRHDDRLTSFEAFDLAMRAMREGMGGDAFFLGCSAEFGTTFGHVDGLRTGGDIDPTYSRFSRSCLENGGTFYLNGVVTWNDCDYLVVRSRDDEDAELVNNPRKTGGDMPEALAEMWMHYVGLFGGPKILGDNLTILRPSRQALASRAMALPLCDRFVPLDYWAEARHRDDPFHVILGEGPDASYLALFNWDELERTYHFAGGPAGMDAGTRPFSGEATMRREQERLLVSLAGHHSAVIRITGADFDVLRRLLQVK